MNETRVKALRESPLAPTIELLPETAARLQAERQASMSPELRALAEAEGVIRQLDKAKAIVERDLGAGDLSREHRFALRQLLSRTESTRALVVSMHAKVLAKIAPTEATTMREALGKLGALVERALAPAEAPAPTPAA